MTMLATLLLPVALASATATNSPPIESAVYLTGAWFAPGTDAQRRLYLEGGFTLVPYLKRNVEWARKNKLRFIGSVSSWGMRSELNELFEAGDGSRSTSVGLFTRINFNAPRIAAWWEGRVPELVRQMPGAERVAFWKVHNEFGYHSGKVYDYSTGSIQRYQQWLRRRYKTLTELNRKWRTTWKSFESIQPPRTREEMKAHLANWLEWRRFTCWNFADYFHHTGDLIRTVTPGAAVSDNFYPTSPLQGWDDFELARQTDYMAYDIYAIGRWSWLAGALDRARSAAAAWGKPFIIMEYHAGPNHWAKVVRYRDLIIESFMALGRECRAIQWFRWIPGNGGREQGIHGMMDSRGQPTERFTAAAQTSAFAQRLAPLLLRSRTVAPVAVVTSTDNAFLAYALRTDSWKDRRRWDTLCRLLDAARIQFDQIDPAWIASHDLSRYRVVIAAHLPVLADDVLEHLRGYAQNGGTLLLHPDVALRNGVGLPRSDPPPFSNTIRPTPDKLWQARPLRGSQEIVKVQRTGAGRTVYCGYELPDSPGSAETFAGRSAAYAQLLARVGAIQPAVVVKADLPAAELDTRRLEAGPATLVFLTALNGKPLADVPVFLPDVPSGASVLLFEPASGAARRLAVTATDRGLRCVIPRIDPAVCVLATRAWQPVLSLDAPTEVHPGETFDARVRLENCNTEPVAAKVALTGPNSWRIRSVGDPAASIELTAAAGQSSAESVFRVTVPTDAGVDRFAVANPLIATATLTVGRSGVLSARHVPRVLPALDLLVRYHGELVTPWQELTPPIMRWGWENEVHTPPPPPVACGVGAPVTFELAAAPRLKGRRVALEITGPDKRWLRPEFVTLTGTRQSIPAKVNIGKPGEYTLEATCGKVVHRVKFTAGVNTETVAARIRSSGKAWAPPGWKQVRLLGVGVRDADCHGRTVEVAADGLCPHPERSMVFWKKRTPVPASLTRNSICLAPDIPKDTVAVFAVAEAPAGGMPRRPYAVRIDHPDPNASVVHGRAWAIAFDTVLGLVRWLEVDGTRVAPWRTGVVARDDKGRVWAPDGNTGATDAGIEGSNTAVRVSFTRLIGPTENPLTVSETWAIEAMHAAVQVRIANRTRGPIRLTSLDYELGLDPPCLPRWRLLPAAGAAQEGTYPEGFGANAATVIDWSAGRRPAGLALTLGRCALSTKWQSGFAGVRYSVRGTAIGLLRGVQLDPGDVVLAEFELWPHRQALGVTGTPTFVTVTAP